MSSGRGPPPDAPRSRRPPLTPSPDSSPATRTEGEGETLDMPEGLGTFTSGQVLGERYQILEMLGRGGMGEVWKAFDLKLRVEVALKALRPEFFKSERRLEMLRDEVRAAREVVSPNVCRIFDLIEVEGRELVSMEYVDGATLLGVLQERGPLDLKEAQDIASQFLAGLEAIHKVGLVHRDIKPENIMLTRAGRVVVMDFGLARQETEGGGSVSGTPAYMAPEQAAGQTLDARADVYSAGVVLAEMVSPDGIKSYESRQSLWEGVRSEPAKLPDSPWAPAIKKAVARDRERRYNTAHTLVRALEDVTLRVEGADDLHPYPGLASFTEDDAEFFFGREAEVEQMWRKLDRPHLLAVVGPSGAGKTSFLQAGLKASSGSEWSILRCTPGNRPFSALGQALAREMAGDVEAMELLASGHEPDALVGVVARWRQGHDHALMIVDQFEELFTHCSTDEQSRFSTLLGRLPLEADIFVLVSTRDDFLIRCRAHDSLATVFTDLTALLPPTGAALRRAVVQPATKCGYRFEEDDLVDEMLTEVEGERGALPLLAFAASRLWEMRDRETGLLTRQAYKDIGGVGGALARHAEATIERIGSEHIGIVRELFRNLVTAEGTRAVREWNELLSVFGGDPNTQTNVRAGFTPAARDSADRILRELIDARLLTSYEVREDEHEPIRRVEIIHESLLANWPRLVRWQTQDADAVQLRDQLRQAAKTWNDQGRSDDTLWTGAAYREFASWRERYSGGLTEMEDAFASAMTLLATRRRRRRRVIATAGVVVLLAVLAVVTTLWRKSVLQTRRAEASKLLTLGQSKLPRERTQALAYATASLELFDTPEARRLVLKSLWAGPPATVLPVGRGAWGLAFSPENDRLAVGSGRGQLQVFRSDGSAPVQVAGYAKDDGFVAAVSFSRDSRLLVGMATASRGVVRVWETDKWQSKLTVQAEDVSITFGVMDLDGKSILTSSFIYDGPDAPPGERYGKWQLHRWAIEGGSTQLLGEVVGTLPFTLPDTARGLLAVGVRDRVELHHIDSLGREPGRIIARYPAAFSHNSIPAFHPTEDLVALADMDGNLRVWSLDGDGNHPVRAFEAPPSPMFTSFSPDGSILGFVSTGDGIPLWDLEGPTGADPLFFAHDGGYTYQLAFSPDGRWLATSGGVFKLRLWPLTDHYCRIVPYEAGVESVAFTPDGSRMVTQGGSDGKVLAWDLGTGAGLGPTTLLKTAGAWGWGLAMDAGGRVLLAGSSGGTWKVPLDGSPPHILEDFPKRGPALDPSGRFAAGNPWDEGLTPTMVVLDLESGERWVLDPPGEGNVRSWFFDSQGQLMVTKGGVVSLWDHATGTTEILFENVTLGYPYPDGRVYVTDDQGRWLVDLETGSRTPFEVFGGQGSWMHDRTGSIIAKGCVDGSVVVWSVADKKPHLLLGPDGGVGEPRISPDGKWIATISDGHVRLWPMPDLTKQPLHLLPHEELLAKLKRLTNLRVVPSEESSTGYGVEPDFTAYRGWTEVPEW